MRRGAGLPRRTASRRDRDDCAARQSAEPGRAGGRSVGLKALVFGAGGQLGSELTKLLGPETGLAHGDASITDSSAVDAVIAERRPEVVFNCAAYNAVDRAESEADVAQAVNALGPLNLAVSCRRHGAQLVHFSTNFVFDGSLDRPYVEADEPAPLSAYARTKLEGERHALANGAHVLIVRTAAVFGGPASFPMRVLERARKGEALRVVSDQMINPTYAKDLAAAALELAEAGTAGIVHAVGGGCCGWDELARVSLSELGVEARVESVATASYPTPARRPRNGCLDTTRFRSLRPWREALGEWARSLKYP